MKFVTIRYEGARPYTDRTPLKTHWEPGDVNQVSERDAKILRGYLEFKEVLPTPKKTTGKTAATGASTGAADDAKTEAEAEALELAKKANAEQMAREQKAKRQSEEALMEVGRMSKDQLAAYAKQNYAVELDTKSKVGDLRNQVTVLVQAGLN